MLAALIGTMYVLVDVIATRTPYLVLIHYLSFSTGSAYNRVLIWRYASDDLFRNPIFGIGFREWDRPGWMHSSSTDNFWLVVALNYGIPAFALLLGVLVYSLRHVMKHTSHDEQFQLLRRAWVIMLVGLSVAVLTVHLWGATVILFIFYLGMSVWYWEFSIDRLRRCGKWKVG